MARVWQRYPWSWNLDLAAMGNDSWMCEPRPRCEGEGPADCLKVGAPEGRNDRRAGTPHPGCFGKRGCKRLKTKEGSAEKSAKRGIRGCKLLRTWDLPQRHGATEAAKS